MRNKLISVGILICFCILSILPIVTQAQAAKAVHGVVFDQANSPLSSVSVVIKGSSRGTTTNDKGEFTINATTADNLVFSLVGFKSIIVAVGNLDFMSITLAQDVGQQLEDVVIVGYGKQERATVVSSVTTIQPKELKGPTSNLTTMLGGKIAGMISFQRSGEPGQDNASFFIRGLGTFGVGKVDPLILIDGIESSPTDLARLQPDDIDGFSVLKDATATSVYGARGANGVILVTTKSGTIGKMKLNFRSEMSNSSNSENIKLADNVNFMKLANESVLTRNPLSSTLYGRSKIDHTEAGDDPLIYPNNNWIKQLISPNTKNFRNNLNVAGGVDKAQYYLALTYNIDNGNLRRNSLNGFNNNIKLQSYSLLSNIDLVLTKNTKAKVSLKGQFDDYNGPIGGGATVYNSALWSNPVAFPAIYPADMVPTVDHPLFGNALIPGSTTALYNNPYAQSLSGFQQYNTSAITAQINLEQKLSMITPGLSARAMAYTTRYSYFTVERGISPFYYSPVVINGVLSGISLINDGSAGNPFTAPTEYLTYTPGDKVVNTSTYAEAALNYSRSLGLKHKVGGMVIGILRNFVTGNAPTLQLSLPSRNVGLSGRFTYGYDERYLFEFDFGYNGSERFSLNHRFGFFPSIGGGWVVSKEKFFEPLKNTINKMKFRFTYGLVGNDQIGNPDDRFFYLSQVSLDGSSYGGFGTKFTYSRPTVVISRYSNPEITWERSRQLNLGIDATILDNINLTVDAYQQHRSNILMVRNTIPITMGLESAISANTGKASSKGIDIALDYNKTLSKNVWIQGRGTFTYAVSEVIVNEEPEYELSNINLTKVGQSLNRIYGLVAERLFIDQHEVNNSPNQFGTIMAGDIKYRDINNDGNISIEDFVPMGFPTVPEITYGYGFSLGISQFDVSLFFQGIARTSFMIDTRGITPFANQNGLLKAIVESHWSEDNNDPYAFWPRLNSVFSDNNNQPSSWWLRNGSLMRLKSAEIGYNLSDRLIDKLHLTTGRIYINGTNLLTFSQFKLWDPEMGAAGLGYPIQRVVNVGVQVGF